MTVQQEKRKGLEAKGHQDLLPATYCRLVTAYERHFWGF